MDHDLSDLGEEMDFLSPDLYENDSEPQDEEPKAKAPVKKATTGGKKPTKQRAASNRGTGMKSKKGKTGVNPKSRSAKLGKDKARAGKENAEPMDDDDLDAQVAAVTEKRGRKITPTTASKLKKRRLRNEAGNDKTKPDSKASNKKTQKRKSSTGRKKSAESSGSASTSDSEDAAQDQLERAVDEEDAEMLKEIKAKTGAQEDFLTVASGEPELSDMTMQAVESFGKYRICVRSDDNVRPSIFVLGKKPRRSARLLLSLARGIWILNSDWILASISAGSWQPFDDFEATNVFAGAVRARLARKNGDKGIFHGHRFGLVGRTTMPGKQLRDLIAACDGRVCDTRCDIVVVCEGAIELEIKTRQVGSGARWVTEKWIFDSVENWLVQETPDRASLPIER